MEIDILTRYVNNYFPAPDSSCNSRMFRTKSIARWAAYAVLERILDSPSKTPKSVIEAFQLEMLYFMGIAKTEQSEDTFSIAYEIAGSLAEII